MTAAEEFVGKFLAHYADQYYDPAKAHEYYEQHKQLTGRQSTKGMSETQKEAFAYAKTQINAAKKTDLQSAAQSRKDAVQQLRAAAQAQAQEISSKLSDLLKSMKDPTGPPPTVKSVDDSIKQKIAALPPIPDGVSDKQRAALVKLRDQQIAQIQGEGAKQRQAAVAAASGDARAAAKAQRATITANLKGAVVQAQASYQTQREQLKAKYDQATQTEYDKIKTKLPSAPAKATSKKAKKTKFVIPPGA